MSLGLDQHILAKDLDGTENKTNLGANAILGAVDSEGVGRKTTVWYDWGLSKIVIALQNYRVTCLPLGVNVLCSQSCHHPSRGT